MCDTVHLESLLSQALEHLKNCPWYWHMRIELQSQWLSIKTNNIVPEGKQLCSSLFITKQDSSIGASTEETVQMELLSRSGLHVQRRDTNHSDTAICTKQTYIYLMLRGYSWVQPHGKSQIQSMGFCKINICIIQSPGSCINRAKQL